MFYALEDERGMYIDVSQKMGGCGNSVRCTRNIYDAKTTTSQRLAIRWKNRINNISQKSVNEFQTGKSIENTSYCAFHARSWLRIGPVTPVKIIHLTLTKTGEEPQNAV